MSTTLTLLLIFFIVLLFLSKQIVFWMFGITERLRLQQEQNNLLKELLRVQRPIVTNISLPPGDE